MKTTKTQVGHKLISNLNFVMVILVVFSLGAAFIGQPSISTVLSAVSTLGCVAIVFYSIKKKFLFVFYRISAIAGLVSCLFSIHLISSYIDSALEIAVKKADIDQIHWLCGLGYDANAETDLSQGANLLTAAVLCPYYVYDKSKPNDRERIVTNVVRALVECGANVNKYNHNGYAAIHLAADLDYCQTVSYLLDAGADVNLPIRSNYKDSGQTPLDIAKDGGSQEMTELLELHGTRNGKISD